MYGKLAFEIKLRCGDNGEKLDAYKNYGEILLKKNQINEAKKMFLKALEFSTNEAPNADRMKCYESLAGVNEMLKEYKEESKYLKLASLY